MTRKESHILVAEDSPARTEHMTLEGGCILVVEDSQTQAEQLKGILEKAGY